MMPRSTPAWLAVAVVASSVSFFAQTTVPAIAFDANADVLKLPNDVFLGPVAGVGTNSKGHVFVYTRTGHPYATLGDNRTFSHGGSRLFEFEQGGKFVRELGQDVYGFNAAIGLRVDPQDNVWAIDQAASQVIKFDAEGRVALVLGRKPEAISVRPNAAPAAAPLRGRLLVALGGVRAPRHRRKVPVRVVRERVHRPPAVAVPVAGVAEPARPVPASVSRPMSPGIEAVTSTLPTASARTIALPSSTRTAASCCSGDRPVQARESSTARKPSR